MKNIDLNGIKGFEYLYSADKNDGFIEVRIDSRAGPVISKTPFEKTGSWTANKTLKGELDKPVSGRHDIYFFVMKSEKPDNSGFINLRQISFK